MATYGFVHLEYGSQYRHQSIDVLAKMWRHLRRKGDVVSLAIVDNSTSSVKSHLQVVGFESTFFIGGDNSNYEFSGWDVGISATRDAGVCPDVWIFSNDTVNRNHGWGSKRIENYVHEQSKLHDHTGPWMFGEVINLPCSLITPLGPQLEFVSSYLFAMNERLCKGLHTLSPANEDLDALVLDRYSPGCGLFRDLVDPAYSAYISRWLIPNETATFEISTYKWYRAAPLSADNFYQLRMKARCIISEHMLSFRAQSLGAYIRSPYDAFNVRDHLHKTFQLIYDKIVEKLILRCR
jgi:hypothetical protein